MSPPTRERAKEAEQKREQQAEDRASRILFSVKCLRPSENYPYEVAVFETELSIPVGASREKTENALTAWYKMIDAGVEVGRMLAVEEQSG